MATKLNKPVTREITGWAAIGEKDGNRPLIVTLNPAGFLTFRLKGRQQSYDLDFSSAYHTAVKRWAMKKIEENKRDKEIRGLS